MDKRSLLFVAAFMLVMIGVNLFFGYREGQKAPPPAPAVMKTEQVVAPPKAPTDERFYVLENGYQQLVFSDRGGALAEINLPFASQGVKEIGFDKEMEERAPYNDLYPEGPYYVPGESGPVLQEKRSLGGYYPLLRRPLVEANGERVGIAPRFYAFNIVSKFPEMAEQRYQVKEFKKDKIVFESSQGRRRITKTFSLPGGASPYVIDLEVAIEGDSEAAKGLYLTSGVPDVEWLSGSPVPVLKMREVRGQKASMEKIGLPKKGQMAQAGSLSVDWLANSNGFFSLIMDPLDGAASGYRAERVPGEEVPSRLIALQSTNSRFKAQNLPGFMLQLPLGEGRVQHFRLIAGPASRQVLKTLDRTYTNGETGKSPDYLASQTSHGYFRFIATPFSKFLLVILNGFYAITRSWGFSIILLTVVLRILLYPLSNWSMKSMRRMQLIGPEVKALQEKYKHNPKKAQVEVMSLYRRKRVNPFSGCLPLLIQMPFLIGMFDLLKSTFELRGASFIPGWIDNLAAPDVLFSWNTPIFFFGTSFHLLPFLLGGVMFIQQRFATTLPKNKAEWTDQQRQQRLMSNVMSIVFTVMFYNFPSGLNIYWLSSMGLGILQQWITNKRMDKKGEIAEAKGASKAKATS
ncbi:MAG: membrane protein insertase YidC [Parachlamydiales bacterium]